MHFWRASWLLAYIMCAVVGIQGFSASAEAQGWLEDRDRTEGAGIRLGNFELHPGVGAELGYDSNVFNEEADPTGGAILRVTPHLYLSTLGAQRKTAGGAQSSPPAADFRAGLSASYYKFFVDRTRDDIGVDADLRLTISPQRPVSVILTETFGRNVRPFAGAGALDENYTRDHNEAGAEARFQTRGGVLQGHAGYVFELDVFEGDSFDFANSLTHAIKAGAAWRFLPSTALLYDFKLRFVDYTNTSDAPATFLEDNTTMSTQVGLNGAVTNRLSVTALVGYGVGFFDIVSDYESVVARVSAKWKLSISTQLEVGYDRNFSRALAGNFVRHDKGFLDLQTLFGRALLLGAKGSVGYYDFGLMLDPTGAPLGAGGDFTRQDVRARAEVYGEYRVRDWLGLTGSLGYTGAFTDFEYLVTRGPILVPDAAEYQKFEAWLGVRAFY